jgi:hypothetical protein
MPSNNCKLPLPWGGLDAPGLQSFSQKLLIFLKNEIASSQECTYALNISHKWIVKFCSRAFVETLYFAKNAELINSKTWTPHHSYHIYLLTGDENKCPLNLQKKYFTDFKSKIRSLGKQLIKAPMGYVSPTHYSLSSNLLSLFSAKKSGIILQFLDHFMLSLEIDSYPLNPQHLKHTLAKRMCDFIEAELSQQMIPGYIAKRAVALLFTQLNEIINTSIATFKAVSKVKSHHVWSGCSSVGLYRRAFIEKIRLDGYKCVAHDHGYSTAHLNPLPALVSDYNSCDAFITYNEHLAKIKQDTTTIDLISNSCIPQFNFSLHDDMILAEEEEEVGSETNPSVIYIGGPYLDITDRLALCLPNAHYFLFQRRILQDLVKFSGGANIYFKPHPEFMQDFSEFSAMGVNILTSRLENIKIKFDRIIIDALSSTTNAAVITSKLPIALINWGGDLVTQHADGLLKKRIDFIQTTYNEMNCLDYDTEDLYRFLDKKNSKKINNEFSNYYYRGWLKKISKTSL